MICYVADQKICAHKICSHKCGRSPYRIFSWRVRYEKMSVQSVYNGWPGVESMQNKIFLIIDFEANDTQRTFGIIIFFFISSSALFLFFHCCCLFVFIEDKIHRFLELLTFRNPYAYLSNVAVLLCVGDIIRKAIFSLYIYITSHKHIHLDGCMGGAGDGRILKEKSKFSIFIPDCCVPIKWRLAVQVNVSQCTLDLWLSQYRCTNQSLPG